MTRTVSDLETIVREHGPMIERIAASHEANPQRREELQQDILAALWRALPSYRGESSVRTFVARVAHNRSITHVARAAAEPRLAELDESWASADPTPHETMERQDQQRRLMQAVRRLPLNARELVILTLEGFTPREIASTLELTPNVISIRLTRAKQLLREYLGSPDESR